MNKNPFKCKSFCCLATILFSIFVLFGSANAEFFSVSKTDDTNDGVCDSDCSLREAVTAANNAPSDDVITFYGPIFDYRVRQINLVGDSINIANNGMLNIQGPGSEWLTVSGSNSYRVFYVRPSARGSISGLTMRDGRGYGQNFLFSGGCLYNSAGANFSLFNVVITGCSVSSPDPGIPLFGGGIYNLGTLNLNNTRVQNNRVPVSTSPAASSSGGGIYNGSQATLSLDYSSVINNTVEGGGGGIGNNDQATLNLRNSTVSGNSATGTNGLGGGIINSAIVNATHATVANNSATTAHGGVSTSDSGTYNSRNSIYADNKVGELNRDFRGPLISGGFNLVEYPTDAVITGDQNTNIFYQDPILRPLNPAGYHIPNQLSVVVDKGNSFGFSNDQRIQSRPYDNPNRPNVPGGDGADIGAIELQYSEIPNQTPFDFDGDRKSDISIYRPSTGTWWLSQSGSNTLGGRAFGISTDIPVSTDFTGDNKTDQAHFRTSDATWRILRSEEFVLVTFQFGAGSDIPAPGDFDGDNKADAAVYRPSTGQWFIRRSTDGVIAAQYFGLPEDKPAVADYDGDGKDDVAIYRPSTGAWWINRSSQGIVAIQFGSSEDKIVQGDYTGDNKADLALWRPSNGYWYILRSEDFSFYGFPFGSNGDKPVPGDYDGDGNLDAGVFRPSDNVWYLLRSTQGVSIRQFGTSGDVPIPNIFVR